MARGLADGRGRGKRAGAQKGGDRGGFWPYLAHMDSKRLTELEENIAHLTRMLDELSEVVARQDAEMALLAHRVQMLMERAAERELEAGGTALLTDEKPPHY